MSTDQLVSLLLKPGTLDRRIIHSAQYSLAVRFAKRTKMESSAE